MMLWNSMALQDASNMTLEQTTYFHDYLMMVMLVIIPSVGYFMVPAPIGKGYPSSIVANHVVESSWTILPIVVLILLVHPPIYLLYLIDENSTDFSRTSKVVGHQRHRAYELDSVGNSEVDPHINSDGVIRPLDVDNRVMAPPQESTRAPTTPNDVLHSWALPASGPKMDAVPGRPNQPIFMAMINPVVHGQRPETCGVNHSSTPTVLEFVSITDPVHWYSPLKVLAP